MTRFWTSDLHFGHQNIITYCNRPVSSVDEMNDWIVANWNAVVDPDDEVVIVGDFAMGKIADTLQFAGKLNGNLILICGNHDRPWDGHRKKGDWYRKYMDAGFAEVLTGYDTEPQGVYQFTIGDEPINVCHFPHTGESDPGREDRYVDWRPPKAHAWLIHGHVHDAWKINGRQINVGWDVWNRPITDDDLLEIIKEDS